MKTLKLRIKCYEQDKNNTIMFCEEINKATKCINYYVVSKNRKTNKLSFEYASTKTCKSLNVAIKMYTQIIEKIIK